MAHGRSLELAQIQPRIRYATDEAGREIRMPAGRWARRITPSAAFGSSPHAYRGPQRDSTGDRQLWHTTKRRPWTVKAERRAANKRSRRARRVTR